MTVLRQRGQLGPGEIAGIAIGSVFALALIVLLVVGITALADAGGCQNGGSDALSWSDRWTFGGVGKTLAVTVAEPSFVPPVPADVLEAGGAKAARSRVAVCGLVQNSRDCVPRLRVRCEEIARLFGDTVVFLVENGSVDGTRETLETWRDDAAAAAGGARLRVVVLDGTEAAEAVEEGELDAPRDGVADSIGNRLMIGANGSRLAKMSRLRNVYLEAWERHEGRGGGEGEDGRMFDFVVVVDTDVEGPWYMDGFASCFASADDWDAVFARGLIRVPGALGFAMNPIGYDPLAFVAADDEFPERQPGTSQLLRNLHKQEQLAYRSRGDMFPVKSAFNGAAIYKAEAIRGLRYGADPPTCEHHGLHRAMMAASSSRLFIAPRFELLVSNCGFFRQSSKCACDERIRREREKQSFPSVR